jgi:hypothetical protein
MSSCLVEIIVIVVTGADASIVVIILTLNYGETSNRLLSASTHFILKIKI